jgi:hypothetical protein
MSDQIHRHQQKDASNMKGNNRPPKENNNSPAIDSNLKEM